jgi:flagellar biogenesis protein FliO
MSHRGSRLLARAGLALASASLPQNALAQRLGGAPATDISWWRVVGALIICLALAAGVAFALKTRLRGALPAMKADDRQLRLVESLRLSHQIDVCLVECGERRLLIAASPQGATLLAGEAFEQPTEQPK